MMRHENDPTNHRLMWLLVVQGLMANLHVDAEPGDTRAVLILSLAGILIIVSAFVVLYMSYQARWLSILLRRWTTLDTWIALGLAALFVPAILSALCLMWVWSQGKGGKEPTEGSAPGSTTDGDQQQVGRCRTGHGHGPLGALCEGAVQLRHQRLPGERDPIPSAKTVSVRKPFPRIDQGDRTLA
jgi:predicted small integral membrane protein